MTDLYRPVLRRPDLPAGPPLVPPLFPSPVPGLHLVRRLGVGAHAEVWLATEQVSGERVAVKLARDGGGARLAREAELLARIDHPHVIRLRRAEPVQDGLALVLDHADGGSLAALVAGRGPLDPGETTTVVVPIARALAALHAGGLVHGDLSAANVVLTGQGRPLLVDLGVAAELAAGCGDGGAQERWGTPGWAEPGGAAPSVAGDVWALGALLRFCLTGGPVTGGPVTGGPAAALLELAAGCGAADPARRPTASVVARAVWAACPPRPVRLLDPQDRMAGEAGDPAAELTRRIRVDPLLDAVADPAVTPGRRLGRRGRLPWLDRIRPPTVRRAGRRLGAVLGVLAAGAGATAAAAILLTPQLEQVGRPEPRTAPPPAAARSPLPDPLPEPSVQRLAAPSRTPVVDVEVVVRQLALARASALSAASEAALAAVDQPGSAALAQDVVLVRELLGSGARLRGLGFTVGGVQLLAATGDRWTVQAQVSTSAHRRVDGAGRERAVAAGPPRTVTLDLVRTPAGWRVASAQSGL